LPPRSAKVLGHANEHGISANTRFEVCMRNPRDLAAGLDRLVAPTMQQAKQPFCTRLPGIERQPRKKPGKHTGNQPTRLAHLATTMIVLSWSKATRDLLKSLGWGIRALHQLATATMVPSPRRLPIPSRRWRGTDSNFRFPERSVKRQGARQGEITDPLSSFVSLPYGCPATACVGIKPEKPKPPA
jgi:hypothetical protein